MFRSGRLVGAVAFLWFLVSGNATDSLPLPDAEPTELQAEDGAAQAALAQIVPGAGDRASRKDGEQYDGLGNDTVIGSAWH